MVNETDRALQDDAGSASDAERSLALSYAPAAARAGLEALFALDATLGAILKTTREPVVGQMRLTWWYEALGRLDSAPPPAEPTLRALASTVVPHVAGSALAQITEGWEALLAQPLDDAAVGQFASRRGGALFGAAARILGVEDSRITVAGEGWALADLAGRLSDPARASLIAAQARERLDVALTGRWPRGARALGALAVLAREDVAPTRRPPGRPARVGRLLLPRVVGY